MGEDAQTTIYVDGDACPVKDEVVRVAERFNVPVVLVSNSGFRSRRSDLVRQVIVPEEPDAADNWIADHIDEGDIAITSDIPLAARCLEKNADVLGNDGRPFAEHNIGEALAMRDLKSHLRETGDIKGYNPSFTKKDRSRFLQALDQLLSKKNKNRR